VRRGREEEEEEERRRRRGGGGEAEGKVGSGGRVGIVDQR
jgi:hypothetical protein